MVNISVVQAKVHCKAKYEISSYLGKEKIEVTTHCFSALPVCHPLAFICRLPRWHTKYRLQKWRKQLWTYCRVEMRRKGTPIFLHHERPLHDREGPFLLCSSAGSWHQPREHEVRRGGREFRGTQPFNQQMETRKGKHLVQHHMCKHHISTLNAML